MHKHIRNQKLPSLRVQSFLLVSVILLSLLFAAGASLKITLDYARSTHSEENQRVYSQIAAKLSRKFVSVTTLMTALSCQNDLQKALYTQKLYRTSDDWDNLLKLLFRYSTLDSGIDSVVCADMLGDVYLYYYYQQMALYKNAQENALNRDGFSSPFQLSGKTMITISEPIYRMNSDYYYQAEAKKTKIGQCIFFIDLDAVRAEIGWDDLDEKQHVLLFDPQGNLIWKSRNETDENALVLAAQIQQHDNPEQTADGYELDYQTVAEPQWTLVGFSTEPFWLGNMTRLIGGILISWSVSLILMVVLLVFFSNNLTGFIKFLQENMKRVGGNTDYHLPYWKKREFCVVSDKFNDMMLHIRALTSRNLQIQENLYQQELDKQQFALMALQSQVNPHFLYNTLECMKSIGICYGADEIRVICESLAHLMRYSIGKGHVSTIAQELESVQCYLSIQNIRFSNRFTLRTEIPAHLLRAEVLRMLLQPLVENAILHGYAKQTGPGDILLKCEESDDGILLITLKDNGCGMTATELAKIRAKLAANAEKSKSIGLTNVSQRLKIYYGEKSSLQINAVTGKGTEIVIRLPHKGETDV